MVKANRAPVLPFSPRLRGSFAVIGCLLLSGVVLDCATPDGALDRGSALRLPRPMDTDPQSAEKIGREALEKIGYLPIINLARRAGWVTTKRVRLPLSSNRSLISIDVAQAAGAIGFMEVYSEYAIAAGVTSQLDTALPGPFDVVGFGILVIGLIDAGFLAGALLRSLTNVVKPVATGATTSSPPVAEPESEPEPEPEPESEPKPTGPTDRFPPEPRKRPRRCDVDEANYVSCSYRRDAPSTRKAALEKAIQKLPWDRQKRPFTTKGTHDSIDIENNPSEMDHTTYVSADKRTKISIGCYKRCCEDREIGPVIIETTKCYELNTEDRH